MTPAKRKPCSGRGLNPHSGFPDRDFKSVTSPLTDRTLLSYRGTGRRGAAGSRTERGTALGTIAGRPHTPTPAGAA